MDLVTYEQILDKMRKLEEWLGQNAKASRQRASGAQRMAWHLYNLIGRVRQMVHEALTDSERQENGDHDA